jgi:predicted MFS family arabinose efflux permease
MIPVTRLLVVRSAEKSELISAMNWLLMPAIIGPMIGPGLGGLIATHASWHWIFLINIPIALFGAVMTFILIPDIRDHDKSPVDFKGIALVGAAIFGLMFGLESAANPHVGWGAALLLGSGALMFWLFLQHARRHPAPVLDLSLLKIASYRHSVETATILRVITGASSFVMPLWFQLGLGMSPATAGVILIVPTIGTLLSRFLGVPLTRFVHPRNVALGGSAILVVALLFTASFDASWPLPAICLALGIQALAISFPVMVIGASTYLDVEREQISRATGLLTTIQQLTLPLGVIFGVWATSAMRWFYGTGEHDNRIYSNSVILLAMLAALSLITTRRLDAQATAALRPTPK